MELTGQRSGMDYRLLDRIGSGGEGDIYKVDGNKYAAKVYKPGTLDDRLLNKLEYMIANPPNEAVYTQVAWPLDFAADENGNRLGFIMPNLGLATQLLLEVYPYNSSYTLLQKLTIAQNICVVISKVHEAGYVFGDFNPQNIGVDPSSGKVSFFDTDTYHVLDSASGETYRCMVAAQGYVAPELLEKCANFARSNSKESKNLYANVPLPTFSHETDNFALAVHIFKLLQNGYTPFGGIIESASVSTASPGAGDAAVRRNNYCFRPGFKHQSSAIMPLDVFPSEIANLFTRAFIGGKDNPNNRPNAADWHGALERLENNLTQCKNNPLHQYYKMNITCPQCEADKRYKTATSTGNRKKSSAGLKQKTFVSSTHTQATQNQPSMTNPVRKIVSKEVMKTALKGFLIGAILLILIGPSILADLFGTIVTTVDSWFSTIFEVVEPMGHLLPAALLIIGLTICVYIYNKYRRK